MYVFLVFLLPYLLFLCSLPRTAIQKIKSKEQTKRFPYTEFGNFFGSFLSLFNMTLKLSYTGEEARLCVIAVRFCISEIAK